MGAVYEEIDDDLKAWIEEQHMFFVATAPMAADGLLNCSPKGMDCFGVISGHQVAYVDMAGSGAETIAHIRENGRMIIMFCAFAGKAKILRLYGTGSVHLPGEETYDALAKQLPTLPGTRSIISLDITRIGDSCGYGVPEYEFKQQRPTLPKWANKLGPEGIADYQVKNNQKSIEGLDALPIDE